jgi:putative addiction module component (TIGR02574 family)
MTKTTLKKHLHEAIDQIEDNSFLEAVYKIISTKVDEQEDLKLSNEQKRLLDERRKKHQKGESKSYSWEEVKKKARKSIKK